MKRASSSGASIYVYLRVYVWRERLLQVQAYICIPTCVRMKRASSSRCKHICIPTYILRRKKIWILFESNSCLNWAPHEPF
jgi:hypothetical protein